MDKTMVRNMVENVAIGKMKELNRKAELMPYIATREGNIRDIFYILIGFGNSKSLLTFIDVNPNFNKMEIIDMYLRKYYLFDDSELNDLRIETLFNVFDLQFELTQRSINVKFEKDAEQKIDRLLGFLTWLAPIYTYILNMKVYAIDQIDKDNIINILKNINDVINRVDIDSVLNNEQQELISVAKKFIVMNIPSSDDIFAK